MSDYKAPTKDMHFVVRELAGLTEALALPMYADFDTDIIAQVIDEGCKFAAEVLSPLNVIGDREGCSVSDGVVSVAPGFSDAYQLFVDNGWQGVAAKAENGGMGLPDVAEVAVVEARQSACLSFALAPMLTAGAIIAIDAYGSEALRTMCLPFLTSGQWTGTMNLTEPQAGSDLAAITTRAEPDGDHYRIYGTKIYITWGDQEFSENVIHLVLARIAGAPAGVRGVSMFLVPKYLVNADGSLGDRNDVFATSLEHKLGIHASPTCVMTFGDSDGAVGYLVGEENKGLAAMFAMMNHARIEVGVQGLAISERAYQSARDYALQRVQGRSPDVDGRVTIIKHADVRRMLLLMKSQIEAMRAVAYVTAGIHDLASNANDTATLAASQQRLALLTPVVKAWMTEVAQEVTALGVQIHGGMGFVEETGAAQYLRDARILTIYEGTTGIQAADFVGRKVLADNGRAITLLIEEIRGLDTQLADDHLADDHRLKTIRESLSRGVNQLEAVVMHVLAKASRDAHAAGASSFNFLMLTGTVIGGWQSARAALAVVDTQSTYDAVFKESKLITSNFYALHVMPRADAFAQAAMADSDAVMALNEDAF